LSAIHLSWGAEVYYEIPADLHEDRHWCPAIQASSTPADNPRRGLDETERQQISSYGADRIRVSATYEEVSDFVRGQEAQGKIVTVMSHVAPYVDDSDWFLRVNDRQVEVRAGNWNVVRWTQTNSRQMIWTESFCPENPNYYGQIYQQLSGTGSSVCIPDFAYEVVQPDGGFWFCRTTYHFVADYCGMPVRIGVSGTGDEDYQRRMSAEELTELRQWRSRRR
jgi:hypothetical protein